MIENIVQLFQDNKFLMAGVGLSGAGLITFWIRDVPLKAYRFIKRQVTTDLIIHNYDTIFYDILKWVKDENKKKNFRTLKLNNGRWGTNEDAVISMGYGLHLVIYKKQLLFINYSKTTDSISDRVKETIVITKLGRSKKFFEDFLNGIELNNKDNSKLKVYKMADNWFFSNYFRKRPINTVFLEKQKKSAIFDSIQKFKDRENWYLKNGIPYQYGILLYGSPGTGKTSLIKAIATKLNYDIYYLSPGKMGSIGHALANCSENSIIVIEDIDTNNVVHNRKQASKSESKDSGDEFFDGMFKTSLSDILNSIDGLSNVHGRLLICTTNHIEKLDKALIRPGRFDLLVEINYANKEILQQFFNFYFPKDSIKLSNLKIKKGISVASLQNMILLDKSAEEILKSIKG